MLRFSRPNETRPSGGPNASDSFLGVKSDEICQLLFEHIWLGSRMDRKSFFGIVFGLWRKCTEGCGVQRISKVSYPNGF